MALALEFQPKRPSLSSHTTHTTRKAARLESDIRSNKERRSFSALAAGWLASDLACARLALPIYFILLPAHEGSNAASDIKLWPGKRHRRRRVGGITTTTAAALQSKVHQQA